MWASWFWTCVLSNSAWNVFLTTAKSQEGQTVGMMMTCFRRPPRVVDLGFLDAERPTRPVGVGGLLVLPGVLEAAVLAMLTNLDISLGGSVGNCWASTIACAIGSAAVGLGDLGVGVTTLLGPVAEV